MNPAVWGKSAWIFLHSITMAYPVCPTELDQYNMKNFFISLQNILPCPTCKENYIKHLNELPLTKSKLASKESLIKWLIDFHNLVNRDNGKKQLSYDDVQNIYSELYGYNNKTKIFKIYLILFIFIVIIVLLSVIFWKKIK